MKLTKRGKSLTKEERAWLENKRQVQSALQAWVDIHQYTIRLVEQEINAYVQTSVRRRLQIPPEQNITVDLDKGKVKSV